MPPKKLPKGAFPQTPSYDMTRINVLHIDDNQHTRAIIRSILFSLGVQRITSVKCVEDGLEHLYQDPTDLVLCGWSRCGLDGPRFTYMLRRSEHVQDPYVPVIMVSGHVDVSSILQARDSGITEYLSQPVSPASLYGKIVRVIESPKPIISAGEFVGPDRRHARASFDGQDRRETEAKTGTDGANTSQSFDREQGYHPEESRQNAGV